MAITSFVSTRFRKPERGPFGGGIGPLSLMDSLRMETDLVAAFTFRRSFALSHLAFPSQEGLGVGVYFHLTRQMRPGHVLSGYCDHSIRAISVMGVSGVARRSINLIS